jgi:hypothetical protein
MRSEATPLRAISFSASRTQIRIHNTGHGSSQTHQAASAQRTHRSRACALRADPCASTRASVYIYYADTIQMMDYNNNNTQIVFCYNNNFILRTT